MIHRTTSIFITLCIAALFTLILSGCCGLKCTSAENAFKKSSVIIVNEPSPDKEVVITEESATEPPPVVEQETAVLEESIVMSEEPPATVESDTESQHVVKKGECLWWIAEFEDIYNDPFLWPMIYDANKDKIKNPHLIYPGQVLTIPRGGFTKTQIDEARKTAGSTRPYVKPTQ